MTSHSRASATRWVITSTLRSPAAASTPSSIFLGQLLIEPAGGFVEDDHGAWCEQGAGDREASALAARERDPVLAHGCVEPRRQRGNPRVEASGPQRAGNLLLVGIGMREQQIGAHRAGEHLGSLVGQCTGGACVVLGEQIHVHPAQRERATLERPEAQQRRDEGRLAGTARTGDGDPAPGGQAQVDAVEGPRQARPVTHACILERNRRDALPGRHGCDGVAHGDLHVLEREEAVGRGAHGQRPGHGRRHAGDHFERRQHRQREHGHHDLAQVAGVDRVHPEREDDRQRHRQASGDDRGGHGGQACVVALQRVRPATQRLDRVQRGAVGPEGQELGCALQRVDHLRGERPRECRHLVVTAPPPGQRRRDGQGDEERDPERERRPGQDEADGRRADRTGAHRDGHRQEGAQVQVLERIDIVDGAGQEVAAAPSGQGGRNARGEAVVQPHAPAGQRAQRGIVADQSLFVAEGPAQEGEHLDGGQDADDRAQPRPQGRSSHHVARPGEEADGRGCGGQPEETREREAAVGGAGLGEHAAQRSSPPTGAHGETASGGSAGAPGSATTVSKRSRRAGSCAATTTVRPSSHGSSAGTRRAMVAGSSDAVGSSSRRIGAGHSRARASATRWRSPELSVRPSWPRAVCNPAGRLAMSSARPTAPSTPCRSSSGASGAPRRRLSAMVALKRWGR